MFRKINQEAQFLMEMFVENGHSKSFPENLILEYQNIKRKKYQEITMHLKYRSKLRHEFKKVGQNIPLNQGKSCKAFYVRTN